jgi:hypothetical protein
MIGKSLIPMYGGILGRGEGVRSGCDVHLMHEWHYGDSFASLNKQ